MNSIESLSVHTVNMTHYSLEVPVGGLKSQAAGDRRFST